MTTAASEVIRLSKCGYTTMETSDHIAIQQALREYAALREQLENPQEAVDASISTITGCIGTRPKEFVPAELARTIAAQLEAVSGELKQANRASADINEALNRGNGSYQP